MVYRTEWNVAGRGTIDQLVLDTTKIINVTGQVENIQVIIQFFRIWY